MNQREANDAADREVNRMLDRFLEDDDDEDDEREPDDDPGLTTAALAFTGEEMSTLLKLDMSTELFVRIIVRGAIIRAFRAGAQYGRSTAGEEE